MRARITTLLLLFPTKTTTTLFSRAFRLAFPRRGSARAFLSIGAFPTGTTARSTSSGSSAGNNDGKRQHSFNRIGGRKHRNNNPRPSTALRSLSPSAMRSFSFFSKAPPAGDEPPLQNDPEAYTMESLRSYAESLIETNKKETKTPPRPQRSHHGFCVYLAGGGSTAVSTLAATPGASSFLLEGRTTYDRHSYLDACSMPDRDTRGRGFSYGSEEAAALAASSASKQALKLVSMDDDLRRMPLVAGIGCASVLVSGAGSPAGRGSVVAVSADGLSLALNIEMKGPGNDGGRRTRFEEELVLSHLVLRSAELLMAWREHGGENLATYKEFVTRAGDVVTERWELPASVSAPTNTPIDAVIEEAAKRVVDGGEDAVVLLPVYDDNGDDGSASVAVRALAETVLPNRALVFPGSFNPVHVGHLSLAGASVKTLERLEPYVHPRRHNDKPIFFELSLTNADKPSIDPKIVVARIKKFLELASVASKNGDDSQSFPQQWGIVLTRAPLFEEKLRMLRSRVLNRLEGPGDSPRINFVIGTDTLVRILDPKYYRDGSEASMIESLLELKASGAGFVVGGRLEQKSPSSSPRFVSGREELVGLPEEVASMFTIMEELEFRVDLSSSEIRKQESNEEKVPSDTTTAGS